LVGWTPEKIRFIEVLSRFSVCNWRNWAVLRPRNPQGGGYIAVRDGVSQGFSGVLGRISGAPALSISAEWH
jgi:hypothetical protein